MKKPEVLQEAPAANQAGPAKSSGMPPRPVPEKVARDIAEAAHVPVAEREQFHDLLDMTVALVLMRYRGVPTAALRSVAQAARLLHQELDKLEPADRGWIESLLKITPWYRERLKKDVPETVYRLAHLLSIAAAMSPPRAPGVSAPPEQKSSRARTVKNVMLMDLVRRLRMIAIECGGKLSLTHNEDKGGLIVALEALRPYLLDVVPEKLSGASLRKIEADSVFDAPIAAIDFYSLEPSA
jgi:hypothetical protein